jgi:hypothetical protein
MSASMLPGKDETNIGVAQTNIGCPGRMSRARQMTALTSARPRRISHHMPASSKGPRVQWKREEHKEGTGRAPI